MKAPKIMMALIASVVVVVLLNLLLKVMGISGEAHSQNQHCYS